MHKKRSLDDTCDVFLSRRRFHSHLANQRTLSEFTYHAPTACSENIGLPKPPQLPKLSSLALTVPSKKLLPDPGSSGQLQPKSIRLANGRHHVPRPRNPFILFRCDFVHQRKELPRSDLDDTNISRIAGDLWREMTAAEKKPWIELAAQEKARHALLYPDYKYAPGHTGGAKSKKGKSNIARLEDRPPRQVSRMGPAPSADNSKPLRSSERPRPYPKPVLQRRSSSCPPVGAVPVPSQSPLDSWTPSLVSQDDTQRRQSRTIMYQSVAPQTTAEQIAAAPADYNPLFSLQGCDWLSPPQNDPLLLDTTYGLSGLNQTTEPYMAPNYNFFDKFEPMFTSGTCNPGFSAHEFADMERLALGTTFTDPFSSLTTVPLDQDSPYGYPLTISPYDCPGYSTGSPSSSSLSSGTL